MLVLRPKGNMLPEGVMYDCTLCTFRNLLNWSSLVIFESLLFLIVVLQFFILKAAGCVIQPRGSASGPLFTKLNINL